MTGHVVTALLVFAKLFFYINFRAAMEVGKTGLV
jgi:hypothetical protein